MSFLQRVVGEFQEVQRSRFFFKRGHQRRLPLWLFMITVIKADRKQVCLAWTDTYRLEFTVTDRDLLAHVWGLVKGNVSMDYAKLSRALRYYYGKRIIEKVQSQPYTYRFILSENTMPYLPTQEELSAQFNKGVKPSRTKSLPNFLSVFAQYVATKDKEIKQEAQNDQKCSSTTLLEVPEQYRVRTKSLPCKSKFTAFDESSTATKSSISNSNESGSELDTSSTEDWADLEDAMPLFMKQKHKEKDLLTACFMSNDLPLLQFEDLRSLDEEYSSETSECCSPRSCEMEICEDTSFWISEMTQNPDLKLPQKTEMMEIENLTNPLVNEGSSIMHFGDEMDIMHQIVG
ncbi:uncharacterized protein LOC135686511 isoform X2 [Rhopilema esculentum]